MLIFMEDIGTSFTIDLAAETPLPTPLITDEFLLKSSPTQISSIQKQKLVAKGSWKWKVLIETKALKGRSMGRLQKFGELKYSWSVETDCNSLQFSSSFCSFSHFLCF